MDRRAHGTLASLLAIALLSHGCTGAAANVAKPEPSPSTSAPVPPPKAEPAAVKTPAKRVTDRKANPKGSVFVVEYHHILKGKTTMHRAPEDFRRDLERFYKLGFRPVTVSEYLENRMDLPPGASPMVFTFDDSNPDQLQLRPDGSVEPNCAVGIWQAFAKTHPDFPVHATFFVLPDTMFGQRKMEAQKVALLHSLGSELGNHTVTHPILKKLSDEKVKFEIGQAALDLEKIGEKPPYALAYPFGVSPKNASLVRGFDYQGHKIETKAAFLVGANPAPMPTSPKFDRYRIPRIQATGGPSGIDDWLDQLEKGHVKVYVQ